MSDHIFCELRPCRDISDSSYDGVVVVAYDAPSLSAQVPKLSNVIKRQSEVNCY